MSKKNVIHNAHKAFNPKAFKRFRIILLCFRRRLKALLKSRNIPNAIKKELRFYWGKVNQEYQVILNKIIDQPIDLNPIHLHRFFSTPMGEEVLTRFVKLIHCSEEQNGSQELRGTLLKTAADPEGLSILNFLHQLSDDIQLNLEQIFSTVQRVERFFKETEEIVEVVGQLAAAEAMAEIPVNFSQLRDIRLPGSCGVSKRNFTLQDSHRQNRKFKVVLYHPQQWRSGKTPVLIISHGLGSSLKDFEEYASHLTSYGYMVVIPQHPGSDSRQIQDMLEGNSSEVFKLNEFVDRPLDITYVLDELERRNRWEYQKRLNLQSVGVIGHSFGGYTALALAGAAIDFEKLEHACFPVLGPPNLSLLVQCRALRLPRKTYHLKDRRVAAVLPIDPLGSEVFGPKGLRNIRIPVLIMAGSEDKTAPPALEQIRVIPWLKTAKRYLALIKGKAHVGNFSTCHSRLKMTLDNLPHDRLSDSTVFFPYAYAISLAFFEVYLAKNSQYRPYLQSSYAKYISQDPFALYFISSTSVNALNQQLREFQGQVSQLSSQN